MWQAWAEGRAAAAGPNARSLPLQEGLSSSSTTWLESAGNQLGSALNSRRVQGRLKAERESAGKNRRHHPRIGVAVHHREECGQSPWREVVANNQRGAQESGGIGCRACATGPQAQRPVKPPPVCCHCRFTGPGCRAWPTVGVGGEGQRLTREHVLAAGSGRRRRSRRCPATHPELQALLQATGSTRHGDWRWRLRLDHRRKRKTSPEPRRVA